MSYVQKTVEMGLFGSYLLGSHKATERGIGGRSFIPPTVQKSALIPGFPEIPAGFPDYLGSKQIFALWRV